jgi:7-carboxy-7-deazaguanine synthase
MKIFSIFTSINGEVGAGQGMFTTFVRFAGCVDTPCKWCDTKYALGKEVGYEMSAKEILDTIESLSMWPHVTITGGEPLLQQKGFWELVELLFQEGKVLSVETNGTINFFKNENVGMVNHWIVDYKLPSSGKIHFLMKEDMFPELDKPDWIKFVIGTHEDYELAKEKVHSFIEKGCQARFAFSPILGSWLITPSLLLQWLIRDKLFHVVLNIQIHKAVNLSEPD